MARVQFCCLGVTALAVCLPTSAFGFSYTENFNTTGSATTNGREPIVELSRLDILVREHSRAESRSVSAGSGQLQLQREE